MGDFDYFDNWNKTVRWILFIPILFIAYFVSFYIGKYLFMYGFGWMGLDGQSGIGFLIQYFYLAFICFYLPVVISVSCAPKGKIIIASIYTGLIILVIGISLSSFMILGSEGPLWKILYELCMNVAGVIFALITVVSEEKKNKTYDEEITA